MFEDFFEDKINYDYYIHNEVGVFIPITDNRCELSKQYCYPCYEVIVDFNVSSPDTHQFRACITSPGVVHKRRGCRHCYIILVEKEYFEKRFRMYEPEIPIYNMHEFDFCSDILKTLNTFVFEVSKNMMNSDVTLSAQAEIITHWSIRSIMGETLDMRAVASDYSLARAQHYIENHYAEPITIRALAQVGQMSATSFNRHFKKEFGISPIEYLIEVRIRMAKLLLKRKDISITDVALRTGFGSASHFSSCFNGRVGVTPQEYRKRFID